MNLFKTSLLNGMAVVAKVASSLMLNKILAVYVGPAGYAIIGQFQNVVSVVVSLAGGVVTSGVTKATAQYFDDESMQHAIWKTAIRLSLISSLIAGIGLLLIRDWLSEVLLHRVGISNVFLWFAITLPAMAVNNLLIAIINGKKEVGILVAANIFGSVISLLVTGVLAFNFGLYGALVAVTINPAAALLSTWLLVSRCHWLKIDYLWGKMTQPVLRELSAFGLMGLTSALTLPVSYVLIRDHLASNLGLAAAGYWQAIWGISGIYIMLATNTLSVYYLPRLAEIRTAAEMKAEILKIHSFVMPVIVVGALVIYALRDFIINTLFTPDFQPMRELFFWQLIGDIIKMASWILSYVLVGRAMVRAFVISEIIFSLLFVLFSWVLVSTNGVIGVTMAHAFTYLIYWGGMWALVIKEMRRMAVIQPQSNTPEPWK